MDVVRAFLLRSQLLNVIVAGSPHTINREVAAESSTSPSTPVRKTIPLPHRMIGDEMWYHPGSRGTPPSDNDLAIHPSNMDVLC